MTIQELRKKIKYFNDETLLFTNSNKYITNIKCFLFAQEKNNICFWIETGHAKITTKDEKTLEKILTIGKLKKILQTLKKKYSLYYAKDEKITDFIIMTSKQLKHRAIINYISKKTNQTDEKCFNCAKHHTQPKNKNEKNICTGQMPENKPCKSFKNKYLINNKFTKKTPKKQNENCTNCANLTKTKYKKRLCKGCNEKFDGCELYEEKK